MEREQLALSGSIGSFTDGDGNNNPMTSQVSINWGDGIAVTSGSVSVAILVDVSGSHVYQNPDNNVTQTAYDAVGNVVESIDPNRGMAWSTSDADNRVLNVEDADGYTSQLSYDAVGDGVIIAALAASPLQTIQQSLAGQDFPEQAQGRELGMVLQAGPGEQRVGRVQSHPYLQGMLCSPWSATATPVRGSVG
jgi:hypothetical protein